jgi:beta-lactamase regulating signal transducer with metallopeptidase domain
VWFSTLLATAILPLLSLHSSGNAAAVNSHAVVTVSTSWAWYIFLVWAVIAFASLARVALATIQVRRLRAESAPVDIQTLPAELQSLIDDFQRFRPVRLLVSRRLEVPTAIGFHKPAIILPAWLLESTPPEELKYILLHELAHLRRRDDWTNLAQKVLKALLFFLPSVWWIERRLTLDREIACDDAVLAHSGTPRGYAACLARVAEKSFLRRQLALAQAAVGRMRQLTVRVAMILDPNRPRATHLWKPAIPVVIVVAGLCALPASFTPSLVSFADEAPNAQALFAQSHRTQPYRTSDVHLAQPQPQPAHASGKGNEVRAVEAALPTDNGHATLVNAKNARRSSGKSGRPHTALARKTRQPAMLTASYQAPEREQYVTVREELYFEVTEQTASGEQQSWQMHVVQVSLLPQAKPVQKPRKI